MHLLELRNLNKRFRIKPSLFARAEIRHVVQDVSLHVNEGEIVGLLGKNGAGKSTTFRMAVGMLRPDSGTVLFGGDDISRLPMYRRARKGIGYLAQETSVFTNLTVEQNIRAILETLDLTDKERDQQLEESIEEFGLGEIRHGKAKNISGGEKRRLEVARALVTRPKLIFFDEPFYGVDPIATEDIQRVIYEFHRRGTSVLLTDHDARKVLACIDRAYIMDQGKILAEGTSDEIVESEIAIEHYLGENFAIDLNAERAAVRRAAAEGLTATGTFPAGGQATPPAKNDATGNES